ATPLDIQLTINGDRLDVEAAGAGSSASIGAVLRAWQAGRDVVPLVGGGWGRVPIEWLDKHGERLADLLASRGGDHRVPIYALPHPAPRCGGPGPQPAPPTPRSRALR